MTRTVREALLAGQAADLSRLDVGMLLLLALNRPTGDRAWLIAHDTDTLDDAAADRFFRLVERRQAGEPMAYLTGEREFHGLTLRIDARVLDPRPDTETLVDWALELLAPQPAPTVLDLGTGSGAIALALRHARADATVTAVDRSAEALAVARANAARLQLPVGFVQACWLDGMAGPFDAIVSNPPYIASDDPHLAALGHEPLQALAAGVDGLDDLRTIVRGAPERLKPGGWLLLEHGWNQADAVRALLVQAGFEGVSSRRDLAGNDRCSAGRWPSA